MQRYALIFLATIRNCGDAYTEHQEERAKILFGKYPKLEEAYLAINKLRYIFKNKKNSIR